MANRPSALPAGIEAYSRTPLFNQATVPASLLNEHATKEGVWGVIHVVSGELVYTVPTANTEEILSPGRTGLVRPAVRHHIEPVGEVAFYIEFWK